MALRVRMLAFGSLAAVAFLAGAADRATAGSGPIAVPHEPLIVAAQTVFWLFIAASALLLVAIIYAVATDRSPLPQVPRRRSPLTYLVALVPTVIVIALVYLHPAGGLRPVVGLSGLLFPGGSPPPTAAAAQQAGAGGLTWISLLLASVIVTLFLAWFFWPAPKRRPRVRTVTRPQVVDEAVVQGIDEGIDSLLAIADPRAAIIAAYSSMEASMSQAGLPRRRAETPIEFLARVLRSLVGISIDARRLTDLFEYAKFSQHDVDESMRSDAIQALRRIRDGLTAAPAT